MQYEPDESELLAALRLREAAAFERLMRRYNRLLFRAARGIVADDAEAQDVVQETWLRAFTGLDTFRGEAALATWLTRIAINQALTQQRKLGRIVLWDDDPEAQESEMPSKIELRAGSAASAEQDAAQRELRLRLEQAIDRLAPLYRSVFMLRAVEGLSVAETALALELTEDVVKTRYLRARALLRAQLQDDPEAVAPSLHHFDGRRCDDMVAGVLARLRAAGVLRDH